MAEYIEREKAIERIRPHVKPTSVYGEGYMQAIEHATDILELMPAADVQPVVRCKDCKYRKERHYEESGEKPYIKYECKFTKYSMSDDGFCSFGARMDGEQNDS